MAQVLVPPNCQGMTLTTSGVVTAVNNIITCTALEATSLTSPYQCGDNDMNYVSDANIVTGTLYMSCPSVITNITINSIGYPVTNQQFGPVPAIDATAFLAGMKQVDSMFQLVTG